MSKLSLKEALYRYVLLYPVLLVFLSIGFCIPLVGVKEAIFTGCMSVFGRRSLVEICFLESPLIFGVWFLLYATVLVGLIFIFLWLLALLGERLKVNRK